MKAMRGSRPGGSKGFNRRGKRSKDSHGAGRSLRGTMPEGQCPKYIFRNEREAGHRFRVCRCFQECQDLLSLLQYWQHHQTLVFAADFTFILMYILLHIHT